MFIDIHQHILPDLDDGAKNFAETVRMLRLASENGVVCVFATPHVVPGRRPFDATTYNAQLKAALAWLKGNDMPLRLYSGAEILYTAETPRFLREGKVLTLGGSRFVLLEFTPQAPFSRLMDAGRKLNNMGYCPVYAHIERYDCLKKISRIRTLRTLPEVRLQLNAHTLTERQGFFRARYIDSIMREELVDYIASDAHDTKARCCAMKECYQAVSKKYGTDRAMRLFKTNQEEILRDMRSS